MKRKRTFLFVLTFALAFIACGGVSAYAQQDISEKMDQLDYVEFELEVEYANHQEYEAELEKRRDGSVKARIEDSIHNVEKRGAEAFDELYPIVEKLNITKRTSKKEAIRETLSAFNLPADYHKFELELRFKDGTSVEFKDRK